MRLAAQARGGFYPAHEAAVRHIASFLRSPRSPFAILDPCAGEGAAIRQLGGLLGCPQPMTYAIELDEGRAKALKGVLPGSQILAPASFFGCRASWNSFPFIWLNPPFDDAYDGQRVEERFLFQATDWLMVGGVLALVCPEYVLEGQSDLRTHLATYYKHCTVAPFPEGCRPFNEVVVLAHKRVRINADKPPSWQRCELAQAPRGFVYRIPPGTGPRHFQKVEPTEPELQAMLAKSPLRFHLIVPPDVPLPSPPLALGLGHVALLLASGHLDGVVQADGESPHVVRGTSRKREFVSDVTETQNDDGTTTTRTTISERIDLMVRTVDLTGTIQTLMSTETKDE